MAVLFGGYTVAQDVTRKIKVEPVPDLSDIRHVPASHTDSGYPVPRYVSLKFDAVNGRLGPSLEHPVLWQYRRKGLPLVVVAEMDIWRKVRDHQGEESWVRGQALSGVSTAIVKRESRFYKKADPGSRIIAHLQSNVIVKVLNCENASWCHIKLTSGQKGWTRSSNLWGVEPF